MMLAGTGCQTSVQEGPTTANTGNPNSRPTMMGKEPTPAPIPQKESPADQSSLAHPVPDQRIDKP